MPQIILKLLLLTVTLLLVACGADSSIEPVPEEEPVEAPVFVQPSPELESDFTHEFEPLENLFIEEAGGHDAHAETDDDFADTTTGGSFEIFSIEGTTETMSNDAWERMLSWRSNAVLLAERHRDAVILNMNPAENVVYLTFDDGPDPVNTVSVINTLLEYDVSATFFFTGENIRRHSDVVKKAHDAGFSLGLHGYSHKSFRDLSSDEIILELNESNDLLESITGERSTIMRPPYGAMGDEEIDILRNMNLTIYLWSLDTLDWAQTDADEILRNVKEYLRPGEIILMHAFSGQRLVPEILPAIIEFIRDEGFEMKALPR